MKKSKTTKTTKKSTKKASNKYTNVAKGVYSTPAGTYRVQKQVNGTRISRTFTSKTKAISYYTSLGK